MLGVAFARMKLYGLTRGMMRFNARLVLKIRRARRSNGLVEIGREWQRMFPFGERMQEALPVDGNTFHACTHTWCPLRGTGDVLACYHVMEFDRTLLGAIGGRFVVLRSQAEPGRTTCEIAIRKSGDPMDDLVPAHAR